MHGGLCLYLNVSLNVYVCTHAVYVSTCLWG